jgi:hypothetical protein
MLQRWQFADWPFCSAFSSPKLKINPHKKYWFLLKNLLFCVTWFSERSMLCHCCTASCVQWHGGWAPRCRFVEHLERKYLKERRNRRLWRWWCWGIIRNSRRVGLQGRRRGIGQILGCWCYVLPFDSDCMKESSEWTATAVLLCSCVLTCV